MQNISVRSIKYKMFASWLMESPKQQAFRLHICKFSNQFWPHPKNQCAMKRFYLWKCAARAALHRPLTTFNLNARSKILGVHILMDSLYSLHAFRLEMALNEPLHVLSVKVPIGKILQFPSKWCAASIYSADVREREREKEFVCTMYNAKYSLWQNRFSTVLHANWKCLFVNAKAYIEIDRE